MLVGVAHATLSTLLCKHLLERTDGLVTVVVVTGVDVSA